MFRNREAARSQIDGLLKKGDKKQAYEMMRRCVDITPEMAKKVIDACREKNIDYIVAPYEADAQIAYLMKKGIGHFVVTEDSDLLLFGCDYVVLKLDRDFNGQLIRRRKINDCLGPKSLNYNFEKFRRMCILSGCDYLPNLPGIGLQKARKFFGYTTDDDISLCLPQIPSFLKMKNLIVNKEYIEGFTRAENTFKYQLVFCPLQRKLVPLNPYDDDVDISDIDYAGKSLDDDFALHLALGNINVITKEKIDSWLPPQFSGSNSQSDSMWSKKFKPKEVNPLDMRFGLVKKPNSGKSLKRSTSAISSQPSKKINIDSDMSAPSSQNSDYDVKSQSQSDVKASQSPESGFSSQSSQRSQKTIGQIVEERADRRKKISLLCSSQSTAASEDDSLKSDMISVKNSSSLSQSSAATSSQPLSSSEEDGLDVKKIAEPVEKKHSSQRNGKTALRDFEKYSYRKKVAKSIK